jgi:hypothetical protein
VKRTVLSESAEQACSDIRLLQAEHTRRSRVWTQEPRGRIPGFEPSVAERTTQLTLTTIVAVTEHFSAQRLRAVPGVIERDVSSWPRQEAAWAARGSVSLGTLAAYQPFRGFNEARNAIMHGSGRLTPRQLAQAQVPNTRAWLAAAAIISVNGRLLITAVDLDRCAALCADFVTQLDSAAP